MSRFTHILHAAILAHLLFLGQHSEAKPALPLADAPIAHCFAWTPSPCLTGAGIVYGVQPDPEIDRSPIWAVIYGRYIYLLGREMFWPEIAKQDRFRIADAVALCRRNVQLLYHRRRACGVALYSLLTAGRCRRPSLLGFVPRETDCSAVSV